MSLSDKLKKLGNFAMAEEAKALEKEVCSLKFEMEKLKHEQVLERQRKEAMDKITENNLALRDARIELMFNALGAIRDVTEEVFGKVPNPKED